jgi:hypothetical protein
LVKGSTGPGLLRAKSIINANVSEILMSQAFNVIFKEINNCNKSLSEFKGVDWSFYSSLYNEVRANNEGKHDGEEAEFPEQDQSEEENAEEQQDDDQKVQQQVKFYLKRIQKKAQAQQKGITELYSQNFLKSIL